MISGTQTTLSASAAVAWQVSSTSRLPSSTTYRLAKADESNRVFISGGFPLFENGSRQMDAPRREFQSRPLPRGCLGLSRRIRGDLRHRLPVPQHDDDF